MISSDTSQPLPIMSREAAEAAPWSWWQRMLFRFAFVFWSLFCLDQDVLGLLTWMAPWVQRRVVHWLVLGLLYPVDASGEWLGRRVFHLTATQLARGPHGSGDRALDWITAGCLVAFSLLAAALWSAVAEWRARRLQYRTLYAWLRLILRFTLASVLLSYGFDKLFPMQFGRVGFARLNEPLGQMSPMGLLWTFMGASAPYTIFGGLAEVVPGALLIFRRTSTLGALLGAGVLLDVVMLNLCYDVPVKLYSSELLLAAVFLLLPDARPLWRFLVQRKAAELVGVSLPRPERRALRIAGHCLQGLVAAYLLLFGLFANHRAYAERRQEGWPTALQGDWTVEAISGFSAGDRWSVLEVGMDRSDDRRFLTALVNNGTTKWYQVTTDESAHTLHFPKNPNSDLRWTVLPDGKVSMEGTWSGAPASVTMERTTATFPLVTRGFHWVQETPYNK